MDRKKGWTWLDKERNCQRSDLTDLIDAPIGLSSVRTVGSGMAVGTVAVGSCKLRRESKGMLLGTDSVDDQHETQITNK